MLSLRGKVFKMSDEQVEAWLQELRNLVILSRCERVQGTNS